MPTYQYLCRDCDHEFEAVQSMRDDALTVCPSCGGSLRKVYAPPAIAFKGSGFYATDHGRRKPGDTAKEDGAAPTTAKTSEGATGPSKDGGKDAAGGSGSGATKGPAKGAKEPAST